MTLLRQQLQDFTDQHHASLPNRRDADKMDWSHFDDFLSSAALEELRAAIRITAWNCDVLTHLKSRLLLRRAAQEQNSGEFKEVVASIVEAFVTSLAARQTSSV
jgi:hypothetical protein